MSQDPSGGATALRGRVVTPDAEIADGLVLVGPDGIITWVGPAAGAPPSAAAVAGAGADPAAAPGTLLPGLVDLHCHGGGGVGFPEVTDARSARVAAGEHLAHGTTSLVASLVTAPADVLLTRTAVLAELAVSGELAGIHVEGPFLSPARCGAQDARHMVPGDAELVRSLARAARGHLTTMTVAPEVPGVLGRGGAVTALVSAGAVPSVGHTDASAELTLDALETMRRALTSHGTRSTLPTVTHLFNGMRPLHHRDPGPVAGCLAAAARGSAVLELVADGVHLAAATVRSVFDLVGPGAIALVTDAMAAAGMPDGRYGLGGADVQVADGVARLVPGGALAGGTAHLIDVVRATVAAGVPLVDAVRAASLTPAGVLGRSDIGALEVGRRADVVVVDDDLAVRRVLRGGRAVGVVA